MYSFRFQNQKVNKFLKEFELSFPIDKLQTGTLQKCFPVIINNTKLKSFTPGQVGNVFRYVTISSISHETTILSCKQLCPETFLAQDAYSDQSTKS
jgi:hypothetical protein